MFSFNIIKKASVAVLILTALTPILTKADSPLDSNYAVVFIWLAIILLVAKLSSLIEKLDMPAVLGELIAGIILGNLILFGFPYLEEIKRSEIIHFLAQLGVVILLFQIGLESKIQKLLKLGFRSIAIAVLGIVATFALMFWTLPYLFPDISTVSLVFLSATFVSTSVGISARVFKDLDQSRCEEACFVLGAAVFDDVIGLIILAVVTAMATTGVFNVGLVSLIALKAIGFLVFAIALGYVTAPYLGKMFSKIHTGLGMKFTLAISFALIFAFFAERLGLAPIIGAFAAGLVLDPVHFIHFRKPKVIQEFEDMLQNSSASLKKYIFEAIDHHTEHDIEDLIEPIGYFLVPIFFVMTGMAVNLTTLNDPKIFLIAIILTIVAIIGKLISGLLAPRGSKSAVGWGLVPRGEVQLIFATIGKELGLLTDSMYTIIIIVVLFTSLITPIVLSYILKKKGVSKITSEEMEEVLEG